MKIEIFSRMTLRGRRWFWRVRAKNGEPIAQSEGYFNRVDAVHTVKSLQAELPYARIAEA